jgi:virginiamycin B lyase
VISAHRDPAATAAWLVKHLPANAPAAPTLRPTATMRVAGTDAVTEFMMPEARDLPHDVAVTADGEVVITGMMTGVMYVLDPKSGRMERVEIPVERANPRAVELDAAGNWWVVLGAPRKLARRDARSGQWQTFDVGFYAHSVAVDSLGGAWGNAHFSKAPEIIARADPATGQVRTVELPPHPTMAAVDGGPIPYEIRTAPDGRIWMGELQGNRLIAYDPKAGKSEVFDMPTTFSGPRRFDVDAQGALWIPAYSSNELVRLEPATKRWTRWQLPVKDAVPYVARRDASTGVVWVGTSAADALFAFDPRTERWTAYPLPSRGALVRHLAIDPRTREVWAAYGASPGIPARIARVRPMR